MKKQVFKRLLSSVIAACMVLNTATISAVSKGAEPITSTTMQTQTAENDSKIAAGSQPAAASTPTAVSQPVSADGDRPAAETAEEKIVLPTTSRTFETALAGVTISEQKMLAAQNIPSILDKIPMESGVWIPENQRPSLLELINAYSSQNFALSDDGYLHIEANASEDKNKSAVFASHISTLIEGKERVIIALGSGFWSYDDQTFRLLKKSLSGSASVSFKFNQSRLVILNEDMFGTSRAGDAEQAALLLSQIFKDGNDYAEALRGEIKEIPAAAPSSSAPSSSPSSGEKQTVLPSEPSETSKSESSSVPSSHPDDSASSSALVSSVTTSGASETNPKQAGSSSSELSSIVDGHAVDKTEASSPIQTSEVPSTASDPVASAVASSSLPAVSDSDASSASQANGLSSDPHTSSESRTSASDSSADVPPANSDETPDRSDERSSYSSLETALAGLLCEDGQTLTADGMKDNPEKIPSRDGLWIPKAFRETILTLINEASAKPFTVGVDGYLTLKNGGETDPDKPMQITEKLLRLVRGNQRIILAPAERIWYCDGVEDTFFSTIFGDAYSVQFQEADTRLVLLNPTVFTSYQNEQNTILVSALLFDQLFNDGVDYSTLINGQTIRAVINAVNPTVLDGTMVSGQYTYMGPSSSIYAQAGSVDPGEHVRMINAEQGWIYIEYGTDNGNKRGYVPAGTVQHTGSIPAADYHNGYYNATNAKRDIYYLPSASGLTTGTVFGYEGVTVLATDGSVSFIEYSTPSGTKRGYVSNSQLAGRHDGIVGIVTAADADVWSGTDEKFASIGSIFRTEYAVLLCDNGIWAFVEYNTPSGRKRGYTRLSNITDHNSLSTIPYLTVSRNLGVSNADLTAYCGPNSNYAELGSVFNGDQVNIIKDNEYGWCFVEYYTGNHASKRGYIDIHHVSHISVSSIPAPSGGSAIQYGTSGNGRALKAYKLGTGNNVLFAVFEQHGFEDGWAADGIELVKFGNNLISALNGNGNLSKWTVYVIPSANPDGLLDGYTNNGPGRCTYAGYDMNRSHNTNPPASFPGSRNRTNQNAPEILALENFVKARKTSNGENVLLDVHGWEGSTLGDPTVCSYFNSALGLNHVSNSGDTGYLITWGVQHGIASVLVEFPLTANAAALASLNCSGKFNSAVNNLLVHNGVPSSSVSNVVGYLDVVNGDQIAGWARDDNNKAESINADTYIYSSAGGKVLGKRVLANQYRADTAPRLARFQLRDGLADL